MTTNGQSAGPVPGPVQAELIVRFDQADQTTLLFQRWDSDRSLPDHAELVDLVSVSLASLKDACLALAAEVDSLRASRGE